MKRSLSGNNIKLSIMLSVASLMGMQAAQAADMPAAQTEKVYCPLPKEIVGTKEPHGQAWNYEGVEKGKKTNRIFKFKGKSPWKFEFYTYGGATGNKDQGFSCYYVGNGHTLMLNLDDAETKNCERNRDEDSHNWFDCKKG